MAGSFFIMSKLGSVLTKLLQNLHMTTKMRKRERMDRWQSQQVERAATLDLTDRRYLLLCKTMTRLVPIHKTV